jgi:S-adenosylmethionine:tRNA ribosyltransferase-isomerase
MITFAVPDHLVATTPPEARGLARDAVRLLVAGERVEHATFRELPAFLDPGDLVVVNDSATLAAALDATRADGAPAVVHVGAMPSDRSWVVEVRPAVGATGPVVDASIGERVVLPAGVALTLRSRYPTAHAKRLWRADVAVEGAVHPYLERFGRPVTYSYVAGRWPLHYYQTVFARRPGSVEMPSAGRPFTTELVTSLVTQGVGVAPVTLHTGLSSPEADEGPLAERFHVPASTARLVNLVRRAGGRVVAVGTTVTRALESAADADGEVHAAGGWTELVLGPARPARVVDGLITGWHHPGSSHLELLESVVGAERLGSAYAAAVAEQYLWHEFGDSALLLR